MFTQRTMYLQRVCIKSDIKCIILKVDDGQEYIYEEWYDSVDPTWDYIIVDFHTVDFNDEFERGEYIVRMFINETELIAEGTFTIE